MTLYLTGTNVQIVGTLEKLLGVARATGLEDDGTIIWEGTTDVLWDDQETIIKDGLPMWVDESGSLYNTADVEDRREDGTIKPYKALTNDRLDELDDLLSRVIARAESIFTDETATVPERAWAQVLKSHAVNCAAGLDKLRKPAPVENAVKAHDGYVE